MDIDTLQLNGWWKSTILIASVSALLMGCDADRAEVEGDSRDVSTETSDGEGLDDDTDAESDGSLDAEQPIELTSAPWGEIEDECPSEDLQPIPLDPHRESANPLGETGEIIWRVSTTCDDSEEGTVRGKVLYSVIEWEGEPREIIVTVNRRHSPYLLEETLSSMSVIDAKTGEKLACYDAPVEAAMLSSGPVLRSDPPAVYLTYATSTGEGPEGRPIIYGIWGQEIKPEEEATRLVDHSWRISKEESARSETMAMTHDGLLLVNWNNERVVALDARTGEFYWELDRNDMPESRSIGLGRHTTEGGFQVSGRTSEDVTFYELDSCGGLTYIELFGTLPRQAAGVGSFSDYFIHSAIESRGKMVRDSLFQEYLLVENCNSWHALSRTELLCTDLANNGSGAIYVDLTTKETAKLALPELLESQHPNWYEQEPWGEPSFAPFRAVRAGQMLWLGSRSGDNAESGDLQFSPFVAQLSGLGDTPQIEVVFELAPTEGSSFNRIYGPLSHRGVLYFRQQDNLFAVQLPVDGAVDQSTW